MKNRIQLETTGDHSSGLWLFINLLQLFLKDQGSK